MSARELSRRARAAMRRWRRTLPPATRAEVERLWARGPQPLVLIGTPVDDEARRDERRWTQELIEYVNGHDEVGFFLQERRYHICRAHAAARAVIATGLIPASFTCPRRAAGCPFAAASAAVGGRAIELVNRCG